MKSSVKCFAFGISLSALIIASQMVRGQAPASAPGKENSKHLDTDASWAPDPLEFLMRVGLGGDALDYSGSGLPPEYLDQVNALANSPDFRFGERLGGTTAVVLSADPENLIRYHDVTGVVGIWATKAEVRDLPSRTDDVDAREIWASEGLNAEQYSYISDFVDPVPSGGGFTKVSLFHNDGGFSTPFLLHEPLKHEINISLDPDLAEDGIDAIGIRNVTE
jgi:hypothetical protein